MNAARVQITLTASPNEARERADYLERVLCLLLKSYGPFVIPKSLLAEPSPGLDFQAMGDGAVRVRTLG